MKVYLTNAALGYRQCAYLIRLDKSKNGYNYLCIDINCDTESYKVGDVVKDLEDYYVSEVDYNLNNSPLNGFLFSYFLNNYNK